MDRVVITVRPEPSDENLLNAVEAMQQVIDALKLFEEAERALGSPRDAFVWRLEKASANSPFTVIAVADAVDPAVNISPHVARVKAEVSTGMRDFISTGKLAPWMRTEAVATMKGVFARNQNGIARTSIELGEDVIPVVINRQEANAGIRAIESLQVMQNVEIPEREAYGEIEGLMVSVGRFRGRPAIQIRTELYGFVWCVLSKKVVEQFGGEQTLASVWEGKMVGATGKLYYAAGGRLSRIDEANSVREFDSPVFDIATLFDPGFTAGLDPHEYLYELHDGKLA